MTDFAVGSTFIWQRLNHPEPHRHVIVFGPDDYDGFLTVTISSVKYKKSGEPRLPYEDTCLLDQGDHEFITKPSFVRFDLTSFYPRTVLERALRNSELRLYQPASQGLLRSLVQGLLYSKRTPQDHKSLF